MPAITRPSEAMPAAQRTVAAHWDFWGSVYRRDGIVIDICDYAFHGILPGDTIVESLLEEGVPVALEDGCVYDRRHPSSVRISGVDWYGCYVVTVMSECEFRLFYCVPRSKAVEMVLAQ